MQSEVIDEILKIEAEADRIIQSAREKEQDMLLEAQTKARALVQDSLEATREEERIELEEANRLFKEHVSQYDSERRRIENEGAHIDPHTLDAMIDRVVDRISRIG